MLWCRKENKIMKCPKLRLPWVVVEKICDETISLRR